MSENIRKEIEKIKETIEHHERRISEMEKTLSQRPQRPTKPLSVNEFLVQKNPESDMNKTLAIGYFLENYEKISPFEIGDLKNGFIKAKEPLPSNLSDMVNKNIQKEYMMEVGKKGKLRALALTNLGVKFVGSNFQEVKK